MTTAAFATRNGTVFSLAEPNPSPLQVKPRDDVSIEPGKSVGFDLQYIGNKLSDGLLDTDLQVTYTRPVAVWLPRESRTVHVNIMVGTAVRAEVRDY